MKKRIGCAAVLLSGIAGYTLWVSLPFSHYETRIAELQKRCAETFHRQQLDAGDVQKNGYLHPTFLPYWGRKGQERQPGGHTEQRVKQTLTYSDLAAHKDVGLENTGTRRDPKVVAAFQDWAKLQQDLRQALTRPKFVVPYPELPGLSTVLPDLLSLRSLAEAAAGYAEFLALQGQTDESVRVAQDSLRLATRIREAQVSVLHVLIGLQIQSTAQSTLAMAFQTVPHRPGLAALHSLRAELEASQVRLEALDDGLDAEFCAVLRGLDAKQGTLIGGPLLRRLPGLQAREIRLFKNDSIQILDTIRSGKPWDEAGLFGTGSLPEWIAGRHGQLARIVVPNIGFARLLSQVVQHRQGFLHLYVHLLELGDRVPADLASLKSSDYRPLAGFDWSGVDYRRQGKSWELRWKATPVQVEERRQFKAEKGLTGLDRWSTLAASHSEWALRPPANASAGRVLHNPAK